MALPKRTVICGLVALAAANLLFRYPLGVPHELGSDTTFIHTLSLAIAAGGHADWILHPLSYFGLYAMSYPSALPFVLSAGSELTGTSIEGFMLLSGWAASIVGELGAFLAARRLKRDDVFALAVAALFSCAPFFVKDTFWTGSARGFAVALLPAFLLILLMMLGRRDGRMLVPLLVVFVLLSTIHRMGFLAVFLLISFLVVIPFHRATQYLRFVLVRLERPSRIGIVACSLIGFAVVVYIQMAFPGLGGGDLAGEYGVQGSASPSTFGALLAAMAISLTGRIGPLLVLAPVGLVTYMWRRPKEITDKFVLLSFFLFLPLLSLRDYIAEFLIIFFVILLALGLFRLRNLASGRTRLAPMVLAILIVGSLGASWGLKDYWQNRYLTDAPIPMETYASAVYVRLETAGTIIANEGLLGGRIAAVSGSHVLPVGGASLHWTGPQQLTWGFVDPNSIAVTLLDWSTISFNTNEIFVPVNVRNAEQDWETIIQNPASAPRTQTLMDRYTISYVAVEKSRPFDALVYTRYQPSPFLTSVQSEYYRTFDGQVFSLFYVS